MKKLIPFLLVFGAGLVVAAIWVNHRLTVRFAREVEIQRLAWESKKAELESALQEARDRSADYQPLSTQSAPVAVASTVIGLDAQALLNQLIKLPVNPGQLRTLRPVLAKLEQLSQLGSPALPAIHRFLASGQDIAYAPPRSKGLRDVKTLMEAMVPPSLRFGLFDVVQQIGGAEAEVILAENVNSTGRGLELAYLAQILEGISPGKYRESVIVAAHHLLASKEATDPDALFGLLSQFGDTSYAATAQAQLIRADGKV